MKFLFKLKKKANVIIFDKKILLNDTDISKFYYDSSKLYLNILLKSLIKNFFYFNLKRLKQDYFIELINQLNCKVAIGNDISGSIFKFKKFFPKKISIGYQFGYIYKPDIKAYLDILKNKSLDYFFFIDNHQKNQVKKEIPSFKSEFLIGGYLRTNEIVLKQKKIKYDVMFVSEFRKLEKISRSKQYLKEVNRRKTQTKMVKLLSKLKNKYNLKVIIALVSNRSDKKKYKDLKNQEIDFFRRIDRNFLFYDNNSYDLACKSKMILCSRSNLGHELFCRGFKVLFYQDDVNYLDQRCYSKKNFNFLFKFNKKSFFNKVNKILKLNKKKWASKIKNVPKIYFDQENFQLRNLIREII